MVLTAPETAMQDEQQDLSALYAQDFEAAPADTPALLDAAYALRYRGYCVDHPSKTPALGWMSGRSMRAMRTRFTPSRPSSVPPTLAVWRRT